MYQYPEPENIWQSIEYSGLGIYLAESTWAFPTLETLHVISLVTVIGTIAIMDLRMLGWASNNVAVSQMSRDTLKWTWIAFVGAAITGLLLFASKASSYMINPYFLIKMGLLVLAGLNMMFFHFVTQKTMDQWDTGPTPPLVKMAGILSLIFWVGVVFMGRAIGFTLGMFY